MSLGVMYDYRRNTGHHNTANGFPSYDAMRFCGEILCFTWEFNGRKREIQASISPDGTKSIARYEFHSYRPAGGEWITRRKLLASWEIRGGIEDLRKAFKNSVEHHTSLLMY